MNGDTLTFGDGPITVTGTFGVNGNTLVTMGNGAHSFGALTTGGGKSLTIGSANFNVTSGGITLSGNSQLQVGIASGDTVVVE